MSNEINEILPRLYLSGDSAATNESTLTDRGITHILNLTMNVPNKFSPELSYKQVSIVDGPGADTDEIQTHFKETFDFIESALKQNAQNSVLVHCNAGISRSPSFVIAYLLQK